VLAKLRETRLEKKLSQKEISEMIGISESYYCQLETGVRRMSLPVALKIASILGKSLDALFMPSDLAKCRDAGCEQDE